MTDLRRGSGLAVLVTGGCGYIGSFIVRHLLDAGHRPVVLDNLYSGHRWAAQEARLVEGDLGDRELVRAVLAEHRFAAVIHCAAHIWVGESVREPAKLLRQQHRQRRPPVRPVRPGRRPGGRVLLDRRGLRPARPAAARREPAAGADQPLRCVEDDERAGAHRHRRRHRAALRHPALLQRRRCRRRRADRRGHPRQRASDQGRLRDRRRAAARHGDQRHRLPDARRHLRARLCPCRRPRPRPCRGPGPSRGRRRLAHRQLRLRPRLPRARGAGHGAAGDRRRLPDRGGPAPAGRSRDPGRGQPQAPGRCSAGAPATTISPTSSPPPGAGSSDCRRACPCPRRPSDPDAHRGPGTRPRLARGRAGRGADDQPAERVAARTRECAAADAGAVGGGPQGADRHARERGGAQPAPRQAAGTQHHRRSRRAAGRAGLYRRCPRPAERRGRATLRGDQRRGGRAGELDRRGAGADALAVEPAYRAAQPVDVVHDRQPDRGRRPGRIHRQRRRPPAPARLARPARRPAGRGQAQGSSEGVTGPSDRQPRGAGDLPARDLRRAGLHRRVDPGPARRRRHPDRDRLRARRHSTQQGLPRPGERPPPPRRHGRHRGHRSRALGGHAARPRLLRLFRPGGGAAAGPALDGALLPPAHPVLRRGRGRDLGDLPPARLSGGRHRAVGCRPGARPRALPALARLLRSSGTMSWPPGWPWSTWSGRWARPRPPSS